MGDLKKARQLIDKAFDIKHQAAAFARQYREPIEKAWAAARGDENLTESGQVARWQEIREQYAHDFLQKAHYRKQAYKQALAEAYEIADKIYWSGVKRPDDEAIRRFDIEYRALKTRVELAMRPESAIDKIKSFVDGITDPYFAQQVRDDFSWFISAVGGQPELKHELGRIYDDLESKGLTDEAREALAIMRIAESAQNAAFYQYHLADALVDIFGADGKYADRTEEIFDANPDLYDPVAAESDELPNIEYKPVHVPAAKPSPVRAAITAAKATNSSPRTVSSSKSPVFGRQGGAE